jgi:hypothetical protein
MIWSPVRPSKMLSLAVSYLSIATDFSVRCHLKDAFLCSARLYKIAHRSAIRGAKPNRYSGPTTARCPKSSALAEIRVCGRHFCVWQRALPCCPAHRVLRGRNPTVASTPVEHAAVIRVATRRFCFAAARRIAEDGFLPSALTRPCFSCGRAGRCGSTVSSIILDWLWGAGQQRASALCFVAIACCRGSLGRRRWIVVVCPCPLPAQFDGLMLNELRNAAVEARRRSRQGYPLQLDHPRPAAHGAVAHDAGRRSP